MTTIKTEFTCTNKDGYLLKGYELHREDCTGVLPAVILSHGFTSCTKETLPYAEVFAEEGVRAFVFDFCGGGYHSESEGSFEDYMTTETEKSDLKTVLKYVQSRTDTDRTRIALWGGSQGAFITSITAAELEDGEAAGLLLMYPAMCIPDDARRGSMQIMKFDPENIPDHIGVSPMRISGEFPRIAQKIIVDKVIRGYHGPVLIQHGIADSIVPVRYAEEAYETYMDNGNDVMLHLFDGCDHGFNGPYFELSLPLMKEFLKKIFRL